MINDCLEIDGASPLMLASSCGSEQIISLMLKHGAIVSYKNNFNVTAFHCAVLFGLEDKESAEANIKLLYRYLKKQMIELYTIDNGDKSELQSNKSKLLQIAENQILDVMNVQESNNGWTVLHVASMIGFYQIVQFLIQTVKVNVRIKDLKGRTASDIAFEYKHYSLAAWMDMEAQRLL